jgi:predicted RNase H-like HicB family nuclease
MASLVRERINLTIRYEDAGDGWVLALIPEVPGAMSQGRTRAEARENVIDALQTVLTPDEQLAGRTSSSDDELLTLRVD